jgi:hypothetical protein
MQAEYFALEGISELLDTVGRIRQSFNPLLDIEGVVLTMFDERTNLAQQVASELRNYFGEKLFRTSIPRNIRLAEAPSHGKPALVYDVRSRGAESYIRLAKEILHTEAARRQQAEAAVPATTAQKPQAAAEAGIAETAPAISPGVTLQPGTAAGGPAAELQPGAVLPAQTVPESQPPAAIANQATAADDVPAVGVVPGVPAAGSESATEARLEAAAAVASEPTPSPQEAYPSLPPPALAEAVIQAAQAPEAQPAVEQGD